MLAINSNYLFYFPNHFLFLNDRIFSFFAETPINYENQKKNKYLQAFIPPEILDNQKNQEINRGLSLSYNLVKLFFLLFGENITEEEIFQKITSNQNNKILTFLLRKCLEK